MKPSDARAGMGITTQVRSEEGLKSAWTKARAALSKGSSRILVEEQIDGVDLRVFVVNGRGVGAATRLPAFLVGDGRHSVRDLFDYLAAARKTNAYIKPKPLSVDDAVLVRQGVTSRDDVPHEGSVVFLSDTANIHRGGLSVDVTDAAEEGLFRLAEQACSAVPGLGVAGVDLLVPDIRQSAGARVVELNTSANSGANQYPAFGDGRNVTGAVVEAMLDQFKNRSQ